MLHMPMRPIHAMPAGALLLVSAMRSWHDARGRDLPVQPHLYTVLAQHECGMLAPVLDSVIRFLETYVRRPLRVGSAESLTDDEQMLLNIFQTCQKVTTQASAPEPGAATFRWAIWSARIMIEKVFADALRIGPGKASEPSFI